MLSEQCRWWRTFVSSSTQGINNIFLYRANIIQDYEHHWHATHIQVGTH